MYGIPGHVPPRSARCRRFRQEPGISMQADATEDALDLALAATFPASDAISVTQPGGGSRPPTKGDLENDDSLRSSSDPA
jgi:hypothetical protein